MQKIHNLLKKEEQKLMRGDKTKVANMLKQPYSNISTAFQGKAGLELTMNVLIACRKLLKKRNASIKKRLSKSI